jgi:hypothetical protein
MAQVVQFLLLFRFASRATDPNLIVNSQDLFMVLRFLFFALTMFATQVDLMAQTLAQKLDSNLKMLVKAVREDGKRPVLSKVTGADQPLVHVYIQGSPEGVRRAVLNNGLFQNARQQQGFTSGCRARVCQHRL